MLARLGLFPTRALRDGAAAAREFIHSSESAHRLCRALWRNGHCSPWNSLGCAIAVDPALTGLAPTLHGCTHELYSSVNGPVCNSKAML